MDLVFQPTCWFDRQTRFHNQNSQLPSRGVAPSGAFEVYLYSVSEIVGQGILVVNDGFITGCTLNAVPATLKLPGVSWIGGCALTVQPIG